MGLTGLQVFKLLPNTNCKECGYPTCLAFAMKLAAGKESLEKCPYASEAAKAALGAAAAPPVRTVTIGRGERAVTVGGETVFFRHEKTFARRPGLFRVLDPALAEADIETRLEAWSRIQIERAGESFRVDGLAIAESGTLDRDLVAARIAARLELPVALLASTPEWATALLEPLREQRPLLVPAPTAELAPFAALAARAKVPLVVAGADLESLARAAAAATTAGASELLLEAPGADPATLHRSLSQIRRGALDRVDPALAHPSFVRCAAGELERAVLGIAKFASIITIADEGGETWLPLWTLRQNIYTDPQKPLQMTPAIYPIGEPGEQAPLLVTTNFSLTYFMVSTEVESAAIPTHLVVVDTEGMSVLTAWSAGKFSGERVAKALRELGATERVKHRTVVIPGYVAVISGELEDSLGAGWRVLVGPQEASDLGPFLRELAPTLAS